MVELVDTHALGACAARRKGSNPFWRIAGCAEGVIGDSGASATAGSDVGQGDSGD